MKNVEAIQAIKKAAKAQNLTIRELAKRSGVGESTLYQFFCGLSGKLKPHNVAKLALVLPISRDALMDLAGQKAGGLGVDNEANMLLESGFDYIGVAKHFYPIRPDWIYSNAPERNIFIAEESFRLRYRYGLRLKCVLAVLGYIVGMTYRSTEWAIKLDRHTRKSLHESSKNLNYNSPLEIDKLLRWLYPERPHWPDEKPVIRDANIVKEHDRLRRRCGLASLASAAVLGKLLNLKRDRVLVIVCERNRLKRLLRSGDFINA